MINYDPTSSEEQPDADELMMLRNRVSELEAVERELRNTRRNLRAAKKSTKRIYTEQTALAKIGRIITSSLDIDEVYERFAAEVRKILPADRISITVIDSEDQTVSALYVSGLAALGRGRADVFPLAGTATEVCMRTKSPLLVQGQDSESLSEDLYGQIPLLDSGIISLMHVPLISKGDVIAVLHICSSMANAYSDEDYQFAAKIGNQIASAIANSQLHMAIQRQAREMEALTRIGQIVNSSLAIEEVYERFALEVRALIDFESIIIHTVDLDAGTLQVRYRNGPNIPGRKNGQVFPLKGTLINETIQRRCAVLTQGENTEVLEQRYKRLGPALKLGLKSYISTPLISNDKVIGVLGVCTSKPDAYSGVDKHFLEHVGNQIAGAIANAQLYADLQETGEALKESNARLDLASKGSSDGIWDWLVPERIDSFDENSPFYFSARFKQLLGYQDDELTNVLGTWKILIHPDDYQPYLDAFTAHLRNKESFQAEFRMRTKSGDYSWFKSRGQAIWNDEGNPTRFAGSIWDINEHRLAEEALRDSEETLRSITNSSPDFVMKLSVKGEIEFINRSGPNGSVEQIIGTNLGDYVSQENRQEMFECFDRVISTAQPDNFEIEHKDSEGQSHYYDARVGSVLKGHEVAGLIVHSTDVTERRQLERQFLQAQKMEAVGQLAGGIAHDFNNLLSAVLSYAHLAMAKTPTENRVHDYLQEIQKSGERASNLTRQLLTFSRHQIVESRILDLNHLLLDLAKMLRRLIGENIELVVLPDSDLELVKVDPGQIEQVLLNLSINARDAMPNGGKLTIETSNVTLGEHEAKKYPSLAPGRYVLLRVSDTGIGMDDETRQHMFEPFFTTKEIGKGTGLGLSTCYAVISRANGYIGVESEPGKGTTFEVYIPRVDEPVSAPYESDDSESVPRGSGTILLVEDETTVRNVVSHILSEQGYNVVEATNGTEALRIVGELDGENIDLVLTDVVMPLMGGSDLVLNLTRQHPQMRVLYTSGYTDDVNLTNQLLENSRQFLPKPFTPDMLRKSVSEALNGD